MPVVLSITAVVLQQLLPSVLALHMLRGTAGALKLVLTCVECSAAAVQLILQCTSSILHDVHWVFWVQGAPHEHWTGHQEQQQPLQEVCDPSSSAGTLKVTGIGLFHPKQQTCSCACIVRGWPDHNGPRHSWVHVGLHLHP
jgi:hypothetical protein